MSRVLSLAGFQVTLIGRFWVTPEGQVTLQQLELLGATKLYLYLKETYQILLTLIASE